MTTKQIKRLSDLSFDDRNANKGTERGSDMVKHSLRTYGAGRSILIDCNGKIIAGNKTAENAELIGIDEIEVIQTDGTKLVAVQRTDLDLDSDPRARELALLDNRTSQVGLDWDTEIIAAFEQEGVLDLSASFTESELDELVQAIEQQSEPQTAPEEFAKCDETLETAYCCPMCGYEWSGKPK